MVDSLEIEEDLPFQRRSWVIERIGWAVMALVVIAALLGMFGDGPWSGGELGLANGGPRLRYQRVARRQSLMKLEFGEVPSAGHGRELRVSFNRSYLRQVELESVMPAALRVEGDAERVTFAFASARPGKPQHITFAFRPDDIGLVHADCAVEGGQSFSFVQWILP